MDEVERMSEALKALIASGGSRTKMGFLRKMLPQIEEAQEAGITHEKILKVLNEQGFGVESQKTYAAMLSRIRIKNYGAKRYTKALAKEKKEAKEKGNEFTPKAPGDPEKFNWDVEKQNTDKLW
jgi:proline dehydrogenase